MKIRTRVKIAGVLAVCVLLAYGAGVLHLDRVMGDLAQEIKETNEIVNKISILRNLTQDYLLYRSERAQRQWLALYDEVSRLLESPEYRVLKREYGLGDAPQKLKIVGDTFSRLMTVHQNAGADNPEGEARGELKSRLATQLLLTTQDLLTKFFNLTEEVNQKFIKTQRLMSLLDIMALLALGLIIISAGVFLQRSVVKPVLKLHEGAEIIGAGNLDHQVGINTRDEVGQLSQAFDRMTANLRQMNASLDTERRRFYDVLEMLPAYVVLLTPDYHVAFANRTFVELFGEDRGRRCYEYLFGRTEPCEICDTYKVLQTNAPQRWEWTGPNGRHYDIFDYPFPDVDGSPLIMEMGVDITERKRAQEELQKLNAGLEQRVRERTAQLERSRDELLREIDERKRAEEALRESEEHYRSLFDHMLDGFAYCRMHFEQNRPVDFTYLKVNDAFETLTGLKNVKGKKVSEVIPGIREANPELFEIYGRVALTGQPERFETFLDPLKMWLSVSVYSTQKEYFVAVFDVITARKQAEEKLQAAMLDLERSNRDLEEFAYISSHDLQEPLRKIANFSEMLAEEYQGRFDTDADRFLGYITDGAKRMQALINDLLSYSRVGRADLSIIPVSMEDVLRGTLNDLQPLLQESQAQITHEPLPTLAVNPFQMGQLLQNLITNAVKFRGGQPPRIHLTAKRNGGEWVFAVRDQGIGFDSQHAERIFKVFQRLHSKEKYQGTGIGLSICKKIAERHGGRCWAESEPGRGATFYFTIPV